MVSKERRIVRWTSCFHRDCPELVPVLGCWCVEHIATGCDGHDCAHPSHGCDDRIHRCEQHGGPSL